MRSFAAIVHSEGDPPEERLLRHLGAAMRLPSSSPPEVRIAGACGLVVVDHTPRRRPPHDGRPVAGTTMVAGSIRLADREALIRETGEAGDDEDLVLRAWQRWGGDCVDRLRGEYSFVIWDSAARELHGVRDPFGVRPFYYARAGGALIVSDTLAALLAHPAVGMEVLDDGAVRDYLVAGVYEDAAATIFAGVRRLPPGHSLCSRDMTVRRYWSARDAPTRSTPDPPSALAAALSEAISDRIAAERSVLVFMSGGIDSTALAAIAHETKPDVTVSAFTSVYRSRIVDEEEAYAREAARSIGIPVECFALDAYSALHTIGSGLWTPEPGPLLTASATRDVYRRAAEVSPLALHGHPADALLLGEVIPALLDQLSHGQVVPLLADLVRYWRIRRRPPFFILRALLGLQDRKREAPPPDWLDPTLAVQHREPEPAAGLKPQTRGALGSAAWSSYFEWAHPSMTGAPIEVTYPFCDLRVVELALGLKAIPWLVRKEVMRQLLRGKVSERIRLRDKTPLQADPWTLPVSAVLDLQIDAAARYVDANRFREVCRTSACVADTTVRAILFEYWLRELPGRVLSARRLL